MRSPSQLLLEAWQMIGSRARLAASLCLTAALVNGCFDGGQSPPSRPGSPADETPGSSTLAPLDLVYVCGNKFLLTNSTTVAAHIEYRVVGATETGSLTLVEGPGVDPGYSETELETVNRGVVELYHDGERVARRANGGAACGPAPMSALVAGASAAESGSWDAPFSWPVVALHLSLLPTGKVLSWGHEGSPYIWDPATGSFGEVSAGPELFCAGHSFLADGRLLVSGGHISDDHGIPDNTIFNSESESWSRSTPMRRGRWYPTNTTLGNGDVVILAGRDEEAVVVAEPEVWSSGSVRMLNTAGWVLPYYPRAFLAPDGRVFYAGELQKTRYLNPTGSGSWTTLGDRLYGVRDFGSAVMYEPGKILYVGGGRTTNTAEIIDLNSPAPAWQWTGSMAYPRRHLNATMLPTGEVLVTGGSRGTAFNDLTMAVHAAELWNPATGIWTTLASNIVRRSYHATSILLPDGRILHSGSGDAAGAPAERSAELYSPPYLFRGTRPAISDAPSLVRYGSSFTVATPDAAEIAKVSLIRLGSTTHAFDMNQRFQWLPFTRGAGALTVSIPADRNRTPPGHYLLFILNGNDVPSVAKVVAVGDLGDPNPAPSITLSVTGRVEGTKQVMTLTWIGATGSLVDVYRNGPFLATTENDGRYGNSRNFQGDITYVYKVCQSGSSICSNEASTTFGDPTPPSNAAPAAGFTSSCADLSCSFTDSSTDSDGAVAAWSWNFGDGQTSTEQSPSHAYAAAGTYGVTLLVTDDEGATNQRSTQVTVTGPNTAPAAGFTSSCINLSCSFTDTSTDDDGAVSLWSWNFGDGQTSTGQSPSHSYAAAGTYAVTLEVTDDDGATNQWSAQVTVTRPSISLSVTGRIESGKQYMTLLWSGATGAMVDVYRNGPLLAVTENDGRYGNSRNFLGAITYVYKVCQAGTSVCSNEASVTFK